ncbi:tyrosine-type recombinase/integrase [Nocardia terpenica]|uniref:tyrosine-type recombinase/integrase n=1 Tax=Nocardia terpenica TaxID=455432 RepID=UPI001895D902|nr:tyrosine-type recombinase/integrase [Nocardia terpenica]MBF6065414.1 tyrosine-type recombinase/integrase [Nocardia terpenica]MBF6109096.1 tyrosine-type recombinase/integrase [Nocardia terpenica]MBF6114702.1 tyrosine-type recombinase/integrase [Nocardia terpenica]MBF6123387.1 tyrosine-type recombinase/integrase [Nocardia terpenica]MBF6156595.1 tyrosine-type recombinase/integrase [Nocardia terpenica]
MTSDFDDIRELAEDFATELRRKNRSKRTIDGYLQHIEYFALYLESNGLPTDAPDLTREHLGGYIESLLTRANFRTGEPLSPEYARGQYRSLQQFFKYLTAEEIIPSNPFDRMTLPDAPEQPVPVPPLDALKALLAECGGTSFEDRRDTAIIRLFVDTGCRRGELAPLQVDDVDFTENTVTVLGKGRRPRTVPFGDKTRTALRRYLRIRARHPKAVNDEAALWLGKFGPMTDHGIGQLIERRCQAAGIDHMHPHQFRHFFAHNWLDNGGQEQDLMMLAGWRSRQMLARYGKSVADERAKAAHRRARLGDQI